MRFHSKIDGRFIVALLRNLGVCGELSDSKLAESCRFVAPSRRDSDGRLVLNEQEVPVAR